jgi:hypothetical protein
MSNLVVAHAHEVPLPPPEKPEREEERDPRFERASISVGAASAWVADLRRRAHAFAAEHDDARVAITVELGDGQRLVARELSAGPGEGFVTVTLPGRELAVRLDRVAAVELAVATDGDEEFRVRGGTVGFAAE